MGRKEHGHSRVRWIVLLDSNGHVGQRLELDQTGRLIKPLVSRNSQRKTAQNQNSTLGYDGAQHIQPPSISFTVSLKTQSIQFADTAGNDTTTHRAVPVMMERIFTNSSDQFDNNSSSSTSRNPSNENNETEKPFIAQYAENEHRQDFQLPSLISKNITSPVPIPPKLRLKMGDVSKEGNRIDWNSIHFN